MRNTKKLLKALTDYFPPPGPARHNITLEDETLKVNLIVGDKWLPVLLEGEDFDKPIDELAVEIIEITSDRLDEIE